MLIWRTIDPKLLAAVLVMAARAYADNRRSRGEAAGLEGAFPDRPPPG